MKDENRYYIRSLSPVHIGCDEVYDPTGFVIDENAGTMTSFNPLDYFRSLGLQDKARYADICRQGTIESIIELYKFMRGKQFHGHKVGMCNGLLAQYRKTLGISTRDRKKIQQELNNFSIARTSFHPATQQPFIPGSAIKGALRTAYLNHLAKDKRVQYDRRDRKAGDVLEKGLLDYQKLENDPFRLLKVSDFHPLGPIKTQVVFAVNVKKKPSQFPARGPYQILEIIEPGSMFSGTIRVLAPLNRAVIAAPLTEKALFESALEFYRKEKSREDEEFEEAGLPVQALKDKDDAVCLRLGRHSGAESVTIAGHRNIKIMKGDRPDYSDKATTFWLAADTPAEDRKTLHPFGWASLGRLTEEIHSLYGKMSSALEQQSTAESAIILSTDAPQPEKNKEIREPITEIWDAGYVSFNAGGGGVLTAVAKDGKKKADIRIGNDRTIVTDEIIARIRKKGNITARVTVEKHGNGFKIAAVEI